MWRLFSVSESFFAFSFYLFSVSAASSFIYQKFLLTHRFSMNTSPTNAHALPPKFRLKLKIPIPSPSPSFAVYEGNGEPQSRSHGLPSPVSTITNQRSLSPLPLKAKRLRLAYKPKTIATPTSNPPKSPTPCRRQVEDKQSYIQQYEDSLSTSTDCNSFLTSS
jgi:hypothetical protein